MQKALAIGVALAVAAPLGVVGAAYLISEDQTKQQVATMKERVTRDIYDPEGARFRDVKLYSLYGSFSERLRQTVAGKRGPLPWITAPGEAFSYLSRPPGDGFMLCGELNGKNKIGAYVGYTAFHVDTLTNSEPLIDDEEAGYNLASKFCSDTKGMQLIYAER